MTSVEGTPAAAAADDESVPLTEAEQELVERAWDVIAATLGRAPEDLELEARLVEDLGCEDEALANIATMLELELAVDGLYEEVEDWQTVDDVLESVLYCADEAPNDAGSGDTAASA
ncbi:hypothetical protein [Streptomyces violascens]|uniref:hypothetical protein n=1 Tax=Streptomyces violascens TaxID=67381 RepID=UPI00369338EC